MNEKIRNITFDSHVDGWGWAAAHLINSGIITPGAHLHVEPGSTPYFVVWSEAKSGRWGHVTIVDDGTVVYTEFDGTRHKHLDI
jgi:hypothetical protein